MSKEKQTDISRLVSAWRLKRGRLQSKDVGLIFSNGRIAVDASLNMRTDSIEHFTVAVVDPKGKSLLEQSVTGAFYDPVLFNVINRKTDASKGKVFYKGSLTHPD